MNETFFFLRNLTYPEHSRLQQVLPRYHALLALGHCHKPEEHGPKGSGQAEEGLERGAVRGGETLIGTHGDLEIARK